MSKELADLIHRFLFDLTDPDKWGFAITGEIRREAFFLLGKMDEAGRNS